MKLTKQQQSALDALADDYDRSIELYGPGRGSDIIRSVPVIAERIETSPEGAAATLMSLARKGLVWRSRHGRVYYSLTAEGRREADPRRRNEATS